MLHRTCSAIHELNQQWMLLYIVYISITYVEFQKPVFKTKNYCGRTFSPGTPTLKNEPPLDLHVSSTPSVDNFRTRIKTFFNLFHFYNTIHY